MINNQGWTCPKCNKVYAPSVEECKACNEGVQVLPLLPPVSIPFVQVRDTCSDGGAHNYPSHQIGDVACMKCGKVIKSMRWTVTTDGSIPRTDAYSRTTVISTSKGGMNA